jgi:hypothetical protein
MHVNKTIETEKGTVKFEGELEQNELDFVIKVGLNVLLSRGALPFTVKQPETTEQETAVQ